MAFLFVLNFGSEGRGFEPHTPPKTPDKQLFVRSFLYSNRKYQDFKMINPLNFFQE